MTSSPARSLLPFAALLLACTSAALYAQAPPQPAPQPSPQAVTPLPQANPAAPTSAPQEAPPNKPAKLPSTANRRRAAKLYMQAASLYASGKFEEALDLDRKAADLDPTRTEYSLAAEVARSHAVTALIQQSAKAQITGDFSGARAALDRAQQLDPGNTNIGDHIRALSDAVVRSSTATAQETKVPALAGPLELLPKPGRQTFHLNTGRRQLIQQVFSAFGINATVDNSVRGDRARLDLDDVDFAQAVRALNLMNGTFYVPIDPHRALVARNTTSNRMEFGRNAVDTVPLSGLNQNDMTEIGNIARNVFEVRQMSVDQTAATAVLRGPVDTLNAFNATYDDLLSGRSQIMLDVRLIQIAHTKQRITGVQPPQTITAFNVYAEEQALLSQNAALVQQIISSGLAAPGDTLAILGILLASGQVSSSLFQNGLIVFGGGLTQTALVPNTPLTVNLSLNSSDSRALDNFSLRLEDGQEGTLKSGSRYPIMTSSFSNLGVANSALAGVTLPGTSGSLGSLLSNFTGATTNIPQFQYEDLGLTLKARPRVLRSGDVALNVDLKLTALAGGAINNVPILANRSYQGAVTVPQNEGVVLAAELDKTETRAISGWPALSEVPGLNNATQKDIQANTSTLLIIITPHVLRSPHAAGHTPMFRVERTQGVR